MQNSRPDFRILPPSLQPGDAIGIAAPASCFPEANFQTGIEYLRARGYQPVYRNDIFARHHYLAGSVDRRLSELHELSDSAVRALLFARGGYGLMQLLPRLQWGRISAIPRIWVGYSDLTPLLNLIWQTSGIITFHGPLVAGFNRTSAPSLNHLFALLEKPDTIPDAYKATDTLVASAERVRGPLAGGSLTLLASTVGTPFELDTEGVILCLEDVGERPYRLDRMLQQLVLAGFFDKVVGIVLGEFVHCDEPNGKGRPIREIFEQHLEPFRIPVVAGFDFGHGETNLTLPLGAIAELDAEKKSLKILHPVVSLKSQQITLPLAGETSCIK